MAGEPEGARCGEAGGSDTFSFRAVLLRPCADNDAAADPQEQVQPAVCEQGGGLRQEGPEQQRWPGQLSKK